MSNDMPRHRRTNRALRTAMGAVTMLVIVAIAAVIAIVRPLPSLADAAQGRSLTASRTVSRLQLQSYCPASMSLPDAQSYGDDEFRASAGDLSSTTRTASFGAFYQTTLTGLDGRQRTSLSAATGEGVIATKTDDNAGSALAQTRLLRSDDGSGSVTTRAVRATSGDLAGVSATTCTATALTHTFLLPQTTTGVSQRLVVANPSSKPTSVDVVIRGTKQSGPLSLATSGTLTVDAQGETQMDLSAAAGGQDGLYVTVTSRTSAVGAAVLVTAMDGLTVKGSDYAEPVPAAAQSGAMPGVAAGDEVRAIVYAPQSGTISFSWLTTAGLVKARAEATNQRVGSDRVTRIDLGKAPKNTVGVAYTADVGMSVALQSVRSGRDGQSDFALIGTATPGTSSAITLPDGFSGQMMIVNASDKDAKGVITGYDAKGGAAGRRDITIKAGSAASIPVRDIAADAVAFTVDAQDNAQGDAQDDSALAWGMIVTSGDVDKAGLAGIAHLSPQALTAQTMQVRSSIDPSIVR